MFTLGKFLNKIADILFSIAQWASLIFHIWTTYIAFKVSGLFGAFLSLIMPFISECYWGYRAWKSSHFDSPYIQWLIVLVVFWVIVLIYGVFAAVVGASLEKRNKRFY